MFKYLEQDENKKIVSKQKAYELIGMTNHSGSVKGGHYTAYIKKMEYGIIIMIVSYIKLISLIIQLLI